jgi:hypothetical protein
MDRVVNPLVAMATRPCDHASGYRTTVATTRLSTPFAVAVWAEAARTACHRIGDARAHRTPESRQCAVGRASYPRRIGDAWHQGVANDGGEIHEPLPLSTIADVAHMHTQPCL